jgi:hypothetical protein
MAQLAKVRLGEPDCNAAVPGSIPAPRLPPQSHRCGRNYDCVSKVKPQDVRRPFLSKKQFLKKMPPNNKIYRVQFLFVLDQANIA